VSVILEVVASYTELIVLVGALVVIFPENVLLGIFKLAGLIIKYNSALFVPANRLA